MDYEEYTVAVGRSAVWREPNRRRRTRPGWSPSPSSFSFGSLVSFLSPSQSILGAPSVDRIALALSSRGRGLGLGYRAYLPAYLPTW
jgi:hypothetical protein